MCLITSLRVSFAAVFISASPTFIFKFPCGRQHNIQSHCFCMLYSLPLHFHFHFPTFPFKRPCGREETNEVEWARIVATNVPRIPCFQRHSSAQGCCVCTRPSEAQLLTEKGGRETASPTRLTLHARGSSGFHRAQRSGTPPLARWRNRAAAAPPGQNIGGDHRAGRSVVHARTRNTISFSSLQITLFWSPACISGHR